MTRARRGARATLLLVAAGLWFAAGGIGTVNSTSAGAATSTKNVIVIRNFMFHPATLTVLPGALVKVTNRDAVEHTLTATHHQFNTGRIGHNQTRYFHAPRKAGRYHYICNVHQFMVGTIIVK